jgi:TRAP-type C4-dicarboxylate transport system permease small subunit
MDRLFIGWIVMLISGLRRISYWFGFLGSAIALLVAAMTLVSVIGRAVFKAPIPGDVEITQMGIALAISLCLPWCQLKGANIIVDFFTQKTSERSQRWLDALGCLLLAAMYTLLSWRTAIGAVAVKEAGETTMIISLPMWWAYACLAPGLALAAVIALLQFTMLMRQQPLALLHGDAG